MVARSNGEIVTTGKIRRYAKSSGPISRYRRGLVLVMRRRGHGNGYRWCWSLLAMLVVGGGLRPTTFWGQSLETSTGEHRPYDRINGAIERVIPHSNFFCVPTAEGVGHGPGAWEVAAESRTLIDQQRRARRHADRLHVPA